MLIIFVPQGGPTLFPFATVSESVPGAAEDSQAKLAMDMDTAVNMAETPEARADSGPATAVQPAEESVMDFARYFRHVRAGLSESF